MGTSFKSSSIEINAKVGEIMFVFGERLVIVGLNIFYDLECTHYIHSDGGKIEIQDLKEQYLGTASTRIERSDKSMFTIFDDGDMALTNFIIGARKRYSQRRLHICKMNWNVYM